jgi:hypothetical protein
MIEADLKAKRLQRGILCADAGIALLLFAVVWITIEAVVP